MCYHFFLLLFMTVQLFSAIPCVLFPSITSSLSTWAQIYQCSFACNSCLLDRLEGIRQIWQFSSWFVIHSTFMFVTEKSLYNDSHINIPTKSLHISLFVFPRTNSLIDPLLSVWVEWDCSELLSYHMFFTSLLSESTPDWLAWTLQVDLFQAIIFTSVCCTKWFSYMFLYAWG